MKTYPFLLCLGFIINATSAADSTETPAVHPESQSEENPDRSKSKGEIQGFEHIISVTPQVSFGVTDHGDINYRFDAMVESNDVSSYLSKLENGLMLPDVLKPDRHTLTVGYFTSKNTWAVNIGSIDYYNIYENFGIFNQGYTGYAEANGSALLISEKAGVFLRVPQWGNLQINSGVELLGLWGGNGDARREIQGVSVVTGISFGF
jgi:hypothetical protein